MTSLGLWVKAGVSLLVVLVAVVIVLVTLGFENMRLRARWHEVEDGVLWSDLAEGLTAKEVASGSAGDLAGIRQGDVLLGIDGKPVVIVFTGWKENTARSPQRPSPALAGMLSKVIRVPSAWQASSTSGRLCFFATFSRGSRFAGWPYK